MQLGVGDTLSFLSCLGNSHLHLQRKALLRKAAIASPLQQAALPQKVQCKNNDNKNNNKLTLEVSKAAFRLRKQGIQVSPKILHRIKKKEAWKAGHRERREKEKEGRVPHRLWYDWPEELGKLETQKLEIALTEEEGADEFLRHVEEARPTTRIAVRGIENSSLFVSREDASSTAEKSVKKARKRRISVKTRSEGDKAAQVWRSINSLKMESGGDKAKSTIQGTAQVWRSSNSSKMESVSPLLHSSSETCFPWTGKVALDVNGALHEMNDYETFPYDEEFAESSQLDKKNRGVLMDGSNPSASYHPHGKHRGNRIEAVVDDGLKLSAGPVDKVLGLPNSRHTSILVQSMPPSSAATLRFCTETAQNAIDGNCLPARAGHLPSKDMNTAGIEKFLDDEIKEAPKGPEVWMKGVGLIKSDKPLFSKEIKERILGRRRGDWSVLFESNDSDIEPNASSMILFDGQAALVEDKRIQRLAARLQSTNYWTSKVHFSRLMHGGKMKLTEDRVIRLIQILGEEGNWRRAMQVVQWVQKRQRNQFQFSKFVLTTLLSILSKARRPVEASTIFGVMRENFSSYPDMAAYHVMAVTLGQAGHLRELLQLMESLEVGPLQQIKFIPRVNWDPTLYPDIVVFNAVLVACISTKEWAGVLWTWEEIENRRIRPNGATFGLTIEAMVKANNFDQAIRYYNRMERTGFPPNAQTYKCLVEAFGKAKKTDEAKDLVEEMEASGIVGNASVYFTLACSFCITGRIKDALVQVRKMQDLSSRKPDVITYTGLIQTCHKVGRIQEAIFLFEHMQHTCAPNVRTCNEMIKLYGWNGMFKEARKVYEGIKKGHLESCLLFDSTTRLSCDLFTYELMLKAALVSEKWDYFDEVYWDMTSHGYHLSGRTNQWVLLKVSRLNKIDIADDMLQHFRKCGETPQSRLYEAQILACLQVRCIQKALIYLNYMRVDGYQIVPIIRSLQDHVDKETWGSFMQTLNSLCRFGDVCGAL